MHPLCVSAVLFYSALATSSHAGGLRPHAVKSFEPPAPFGRSTCGASPRRTVAAGIIPGKLRLPITSLWVLHVE